MRKRDRMRIKRKLAQITLLCFLQTFLFLPPPVFSQEKMIVGVLLFENSTSDQKYAALSQSIADSISTFLIQYARDKVVVVERSQIDKALKEAGFQQAGFTQAEEAVQVGKLLNATHILIGSYSVIGKAIQINARLVDVETGEGILAESITGKSGQESFNQINRLSARIVESLTGQKVKVETFKDVPNPFEEVLRFTRKKSLWPWIVAGVVVVGVAVVLLTKNEQTATQTTTVQKQGKSLIQIHF